MDITMEVFGILGVVAFVMAMSWSGYPGRVRRLESAVKKMTRAQKGETEMSKLIGTLTGQECTLTLTDEFTAALPCRILDADDEWLKIRYVDKKDKTHIKFIRIENIKSVELHGSGNA